MEQDINWNTKESKQLLGAVLALKNTDEAKRFLRDLMTQGEIEEFSRRLEVARLLSKNTDYLKMTKLTGLSSTTIARISKYFNGPLGGYRLILSRLSDTHHHNSSKLDRGLSLSS